MSYDAAKIKELIFNFSEAETLKICEDRKDSPLIGLESYEHYCSRQIATSKHYLEEILVFVQQGLAKIEDHFKAHGDQQALQELHEGAEKFYNSLLQNSESTPIEKLFSPEKPLASALGYSSDLLEKIYKIGVHCYQQHQLSDAGHVLAVLNLLDPTHFSAWLSLGVVLEQEKKWEESLEALKVACELDSYNPLPHFHEAICYSNLGKQQEADSEFDIALKLANDQPSVYSSLKGDIKREKEKLLSR